MDFDGRDRVAIELGEDGVAQVRLVRGDKLNALDPAMFEALADAAAALRGAKGLRAVVLSGEGRAFCAGIDLASLGGQSGLSDDILERTHGNGNIFQEVAVGWRKLPVPVVAAIHGVCFGGGAQIAAGADIRVIAPDTRFAIMEMKWGIVPDMGGFALWRGTVRDDVLRELVYTHRELSGEEAGALGLATHVDADPLARATNIAAQIAGKNPEAVRAAKRLFAAMPDADTDALLLAESEEQKPLLKSPNQVEAVMAGMQKRAAAFTDPDPT